MDCAPTGIPTRHCWVHIQQWPNHWPMPHKPTVFLEVTSLVASSCGYTRGRNRAIRCAGMHGVHGAPERARGMSTTPPSAVRSARRTRAGVSQRASTADREQGHPGGCTREEKRPQRITCLVMRCSPVSPIFASLQWLLHTGCSLEAIDMTVHERNHERGDSRYKVFP